MRRRHLTLCTNTRVKSRGVIAVAPCYCFN